MANPFKPTAGARPPLLVGRADILETFAESLEDGPGAPGLLSLFTGPRGIGKTVMLSEVEDEARKGGWMVISETATPLLVQRIAAAVERFEAEIGTGPKGRRMKSVNIGPLGVETDLPREPQSHWREKITALLKLLAGHETGLLITVDEIHAIDRGELAEIATVVQHLIREDLPIGLAMAGLPKAVSDLLDEGVTTFLRRAERYDLHAASVPEVRAAFAETFTESGVQIPSPALDVLAEATGGYPFLIQLVGYHVWRRAHRAGGKVTDEVLHTGIEAARKRMGATVLQAAYSGLSEVDQTFLLLMAQDDGPSKIRDIAARLGESTRYAGVYRRRLIDAGVIEPTGHGKINFAVPRFREFLREQAGYQIQPQLPDR